MAPGNGNLKGPSQGKLTLDIGEIQSRIWRVMQLPRWWCGDRWQVLTIKEESIDSCPLSEEIMSGL